MIFSKNFLYACNRLHAARMQLLKGWRKNQTGIWKTFSLKVSVIALSVLLWEKTVALKEGAQPKQLFHKHYVLMRVNSENYPTDLTIEHNNVNRGKENHNKIIFTKSRLQRSHINLGVSARHFWSKAPSILKGISKKFLSNL